jgi:glucose-fructose oxidoreductase
MFTSEFCQQVANGNTRVNEFTAKGGGPVYDMGVYCINAARYLFGAEPIEVSALAANNGDQRFQHVEEMTSVVLRFPQERVATFTCSFGAADVSRYALIGTKGVLEADPAYEYAMSIKHHLTIGEKKITKTFSKRDQFAAELVYFSDCILKDKEPEPSGLEGMADVRVVEAIYESARTKRAVRLPAMQVRRRPNVHQEIHRPAHGKPQMVHTKPPSREAA